MKSEDKYYYFFNPSDGHTNKQKTNLSLEPRLPLFK